MKTKKSTKSISFIGKKVIVRAKNAGVFFGTLKSKKEQSVILSNARKLWYWDGACAVEQIAVDGVQNPKDCKFTIEVELIGIEEVNQIIPCTEKAILTINSVSAWKK